MFILFAIKLKLYVKTNENAMHVLDWKLDLRGLGFCFLR